MVTANKNIKPGLGLSGEIDEAASVLIGVVYELCLSLRSVISRKGISIHWEAGNAWSLLAQQVDRQLFMAFMDNEVWIDNTATPLALAGESCLHLWLQMTDHRTIHNIVEQDEYRNNR